MKAKMLATTRQPRRQAVHREEEQERAREAKERGYCARQRACGFGFEVSA
jgi:hypothetical protein